MEAANLAGKYEWSVASESYTQALRGLIKTDVMKIAHTTELLAHCQFKAAFQAKSRDEFRQTMKLAEETYRSSAAAYDRAQNIPLAKRGEARALFAALWQREDVSERDDILGNCVALARDSSEALQKQGEREELAETRKDLLTYLQESGNSVTDWQQIRDLFETGIGVGEQALVDFEALGNTTGLIECIYRMALIYRGFGQVTVEPSSDNLRDKTKLLSNRALSLSKNVSSPYARWLSGVTLAQSSLTKGDFSGALDLREAILLDAERTQDSRLIGLSLSTFMDVCTGSALEQDDPGRKRELLEKAIADAPRAIQMLKISLDLSELPGTYALYADCCIEIAQLETDTALKKGNLERAVEISKEGLTFAKNALLADFGQHVLAKSLYYLSKLDAKRQEMLLREALRIRVESYSNVEKLLGFSFHRGRLNYWLGMTKYAISKLETIPSTKIDLLRGAVSNMQQCVEVYRPLASTPYFASVLAIYEEGYGEILYQLYELTQDPQVAAKAVEVYEEAIANAKKFAKLTAAGPMKWQIAKLYGKLENFEKAAGEFRNAADEYRRGAAIASLAPTFMQLASYMDAWSLIDTARLHHNQEAFQKASEAYKEAAEKLHASTNWDHLSRQYSACSLLELGEAYSRQEKHDNAIKTFANAELTFKEARDMLTERMECIGSEEEKRELREWLRITSERQKYCQGRVLLEDAETLDKKGDRESSSSKYRSAAEAFRELSSLLSSSQERGEVEAFVSSCEAWAKMKEAEMESSPELFSEAAELFSKARESSRRRRFRHLSTANESICKALGAGARFRLTQDTGLYSEIKKHLETSSGRFEEAGFENAAKWTRATQRLFDALTYLTDAEVEREPKKRTEFYHLAEKHLELAIKLYDEAGFQGRKEEAQRLLARARERKALLLTPIGALSENPAVSEVSGSPMVLTQDEALGLERFQAATVVGNLSLALREVKIGSDLSVGLEISNVGRNPATLIKLEGIIPDGFELDKSKATLQVDDGTVNLRGRRLDYLKTYEAKIPLKATRKGSFSLSPRVSFTDESGNYRTLDFAAEVLVVTELGISGWLRGSGR